VSVEQVDDFDRDRVPASKWPPMATQDDQSERNDNLLERMQTPQAKAAMAEAFDATPEQLGRAAVKAARAKPD
jgi:hypothetical protein